MTDKRIINGVDVSGCEFRKDNQCFCTATTQVSLHGEDWCKYNSNCYYKQYVRKSNRILELGEENKYFKDLLKDCPRGICKYIEAEQKLSQIAELTKNATSPPCGLTDYDCTDCKDELTNYGKNCMTKVLQQIKQIAEEEQ